MSNIYLIQSPLKYFQEIINFPMTAVTESELIKKFKQMNFKDIEINDPGILEYILQKNIENENVLVEMRDIRNKKVLLILNSMKYSIN